jgi:LDH2 family malate/lactate/ureidoglycolate dehydrogenase
MTIKSSVPLYDVQAMVAATVQLFLGAGLNEDKASAVARTLVDANCMGHATHGLALAPMYLDALAKGGMTRDGAPEVVADRGACVTWRGRKLPGPWLVSQALDLALARVHTYGTVTVVLSDSHHIGALAAYLPRATERGYMVILASSVPSVRGVAPFGGTRSVLTPNPVAAGIPTDGDPILIDVSASITTINMTRQYAEQGLRYPGQWALDGQGRPTDDPAALLDGSGTLLPAGGLDHGHKGYAWALLAEALSQGLAGFGRADEPSGTSQSLFLQVIDPEAFGGVAAYRRQMDWTASACRATPPLRAADTVRVPGERAMALRRAAYSDGVPLSASIIQNLEPWASPLGVGQPRSNDS